MTIISKNSTHLYHKLRELAGPRSLILVPSQLMQRELRRDLQADSGSFAPRIEVLTHWLESLVIPASGTLPAKIITPADRQLILENWLHQHPLYNEIAAGNTGQALSSLMADLDRCGISLQVHEDEAFNEILDLIREFNAYLASQQWVTRETWPFLAAEIPLWKLPYDTIILYQPDFLFPNQYFVLNKLRDAFRGDLHLLQFGPTRYSRATIGWLNEIREEPGAGNHPVVALNPLFNRRQEVTFALKQILNEVNTHPDYALRDFVILVSNLNDYTDLVLTAGRDLGLPVRTSRGRSLFTHPVARRFMLLLSLSQRGFLIDDVYELYADKLIPSGTDLNFRELLLSHRKQNKRSLRDHPDFALFSGRYATGSMMPMPGWCNWALQMLPDTSYSPGPVFNEVRFRFRSLLQETSQRYTRFDLLNPVSEADFLDTLSMLLHQKPESPNDLPDAPLLTEIHHFPHGHNRHAIVLGLHEGGYPRNTHDDHLKHRFSAPLRALFGQHLPDTYEEAEHHLLRVLNSFRSAVVCRPVSDSGKTLIPSPLWYDLEHQASDSPLASVKTKTCNDSVRHLICSDAESRFFETHTQTVTLTDLYHSRSFVPHRVLAMIRDQREKSNAMGAYEGVMQLNEAPEWQHRIRSLYTSWWTEHVGGDPLRLSVTRLEQFAASPLDYFMKEVLNLKAPDEFTDDAESNVKGTLVHAILKQYYTEIPLLRPNQENRDEALEKVHRIAAAEWEKPEYALGLADSPFPEKLKRDIRRVLESFVDLEISGPTVLDTRGFMPVTVERNGLDMEYFWELPLDGSPTPVLLNGLIDRTDVHRPGSDFLIIDYKTGSAKPPGIKDIRQGLSFQLPVYALAMKQHLPGSFAAFYMKLPVGSAKKDARFVFVLGDEAMKERFPAKSRKDSPFLAAGDMDTLLQNVVGRIHFIADCMKNGTFHQSLTKPSVYSDFIWMNRFDPKIQALRRSLERKRQGPARFYITPDDPDSDAEEEDD